MRLALAAIALFAATPARGQSAYDLSLGMFQNEVERQVGAQITKRSHELSLNSDEKWEGRGFDVYFCNGRVAGIYVPLKNGARSWISAVARETAERGPATLDFGLSAIGVLGANWRLRDGNLLKLTMQDLDNGSVLISRWLVVDRVCPHRAN